MISMPSIILKYKSPEFAEPSEQPTFHKCEMPGCVDNGEYKAPKHRALDEYYRFCTNHVQEYNKAWDFFSGMSAHEVQDHMSSSRYGDRPTWKYAADKDTEEELYKAAQNTYGNYGDKEKSNNNKRKFDGDKNTPEHEAMALMGLSPPITLDEIKSRYKTLAKKYHPDLNRDDPSTQELFKTINMSYTILKLAFSEYKERFDD